MIYFMIEVLRVNLAILLLSFFFGSQSPRLSIRGIWFVCHVHVHVLEIHLNPMTRHEHIVKKYIQIHLTTIF